MANFVLQIEDLADYKYDQIVCSASEPRKKLIYRTIVEKPKVGNNIEFRSFFVVLDKFDHEVSVSDHLKIAIMAYNRVR